LRTAGRTFIGKARFAKGLRNHLSGTLNFSLEQETKNYVQATREQFIAAREPARMGVEQECGVGR
jgi:hypothetical protein